MRVRDDDYLGEHASDKIIEVLDGCPNFVASTHQFHTQHIDMVLHAPNSRVEEVADHPKDSSFRLM